MARIKEHEVLYATFRDFIEKCVYSDRSLLWPGQTAWTRANLIEMKRRLIEHPLFGSELDFYEKLWEQMRDATPEQWMILIDATFMFYLPSNSMLKDTKLSGLEKLAARAGLTLPPQNAAVWKSIEHGFSSTGQRYHQRYRQLWLLILFALELKGHPDPDETVGDASRLQQLLDGLLHGLERVDRAYDMRNAILYLVHPESYERIISDNDKGKIIANYGKQVPNALAGDRDEALRQIRSVLGPKYDTAEHQYDYYRDLKDEWRSGALPSIPLPIPPANTVKPEEQAVPLSPEVVAGLAALSRTRNLILYGPPGTGKTYLAQQLAHALVKPQGAQPVSEAAKIQEAIADLSFHEMIALSMYLTGKAKAYTAQELLAQPVIQARYALRPVNNPSNTLWSYLQAHTAPESTTVRVAQRFEPYLFDKGPNSKWHLTDEGRTYVENALAESLASLRTPGSSASPEQFIERTTFHQSYSYEDFVEGLRPVISKKDEASQIQYAILPGIFRKIAARAASDPKNRYVLIIDEINRANIAKVLGELITMLEDDKRAGQSSAFSVTLPYSGDRFTVPPNLYIVGTMNTADRSIALLDVALRRRFAFIEVSPRPELLDDCNVVSQEGSVNLGNLLQQINAVIHRRLDRNYRIGHSYFLPVTRKQEAEQLAELEFVWNYQVVPLIEEYFYSQPDALREIFPDLIADSTDKDSSSGMAVELMRLEGDDLVFALSRIAGS
jgi:5-methylcytosine-specific restriction protein B